MKKLIFRITQKMWNKYICYVLGAAYATQVIDSKQLHTLCAQFDPSQKCINGETFGIEKALRLSRDGWFDEPVDTPPKETDNER